VPHFFVYRLKGVGAPGAGVVDQDVETPKFGAGLLYDNRFNPFAAEATALSVR